MTTAILVFEIVQTTAVFCVIAYGVVVARRLRRVMKPDDLV